MKYTELIDTGNSTSDVMAAYRPKPVDQMTEAEVDAELQRMQASQPKPVDQMTEAEVDAELQGKREWYTPLANQGKAFVSTVLDTPEAITKGLSGINRMVGVPSDVYDKASQFLKEKTGQIKKDYNLEPSAPQGTAEEITQAISKGAGKAIQYLPAALTGGLPGIIAQGAGEAFHDTGSYAKTAESAATMGLMGPAAKYMKGLPPIASESVIGALSGLQEGARTYIETGDLKLAMKNAIETGASMAGMSAANRIGHSTNETFRQVYNVARESGMSDKAATKLGLAAQQEYNVRINQPKAEKPVDQLTEKEVDTELERIQAQRQPEDKSAVMPEVQTPAEEITPIKIQTSPLDDIAGQMSTTLQTMYNAQKVHNINSGMTEEQARAAAFEYVQNTPQGKIDLERIRTQQAQAEVENQQAIAEQQAKEQGKALEVQQKEALKTKEQQADKGQLKQETEQAHEIIDVATIPEGLTIDERVMNKSGEATTVKSNAKEAYVASKERINKYKSLVECLRA